MKLCREVFGFPSSWAGWRADQKFRLAWRTMMSTLSRQFENGVGLQGQFARLAGGVTTGCRSPIYAAGLEWLATAFAELRDLMHVHSYWQRLKVWKNDEH
jgi:hypothetical protein